MGGKMNVQGVKGQNTGVLEAIANSESAKCAKCDRSIIDSYHSNSAFKTIERAYAGKQMDKQYRQLVDILEGKTHESYSKGYREKWESRLSKFNEQVSSLQNYELSQKQKEELISLINNSYLTKKIKADSRNQNKKNEVQNLELLKEFALNNVYLSSEDSLYIPETVQEYSAKKTEPKPVIQKQKTSQERTEKLKSIYAKMYAQAAKEYEAHQKTSKLNEIYAKIYSEAKAEYESQQKRTNISYLPEYREQHSSLEAVVEHDRTAESVQISNVTQISAYARFKKAIASAYDSAKKTTSNGTKVAALLLALGIGASVAAKTAGYVQAYNDSKPVAVASNIEMSPSELISPQQLEESGRKAQGSEKEPFVYDSQNPGAATETVKTPGPFVSDMGNDGTTGTPGPFVNSESNVTEQSQILSQIQALHDSEKKDKIQFGVDGNINSNGNINVGVAATYNDWKVQETFGADGYNATIVTKNGIGAGIDSNGNIIAKDEKIGLTAVIYDNRDHDVGVIRQQDGFGQIGMTTNGTGYVKLLSGTAKVRYVHSDFELSISPNAVLLNSLGISLNPAVIDSIRKGNLPNQLSDFVKIGLIEHEKINDAYNKIIENRKSTGQFAAQARYEWDKGIFNTWDSGNATSLVENVPGIKNVGKSYFKNKRMKKAAGHLRESMNNIKRGQGTFYDFALLAIADQDSDPLAKDIVKKVERELDTSIGSLIKNDTCRIDPAGNRLVFITENSSLQDRQLETCQKAYTKIGSMISDARKK